MTTQPMYLAAGYRIIATCMESGARVDCTNDASCGADLHTRFLTCAAAERRAASLQDEVAESGLDPSTVYEVEVAYRRHRL